MMTKLLLGIFPALTTPFEDGKVSLKRFRDNIRWYNEYGFSGYLALGSTGESPLLDDDECVSVLKTLRECIPAEKEIIAGVGRESTAGTVDFAKRAADAGADAALVVTPSYYKEQMNGAALTAYYTAVADRSPVPIVLYNVPKYTSVQIPLETIIHTLDHPNVAGIKDSSGNISFLAEVLRVTRDSERYSVLVGGGTVVYPALQMGADGAILALSDFAPAETVEMYRAFTEGDYNRARELQIRLAEPNNFIVGKYGVPGVKYAMDTVGLFGGLPRPSLLPVGEEVKKTINQTLQRANIV